MRKVTDLPLGARVDVDGRRLWTQRSGTGSPTVAFIPGAGSFGLDFLLVHERVATTTTSVLYDRAGTGWSEDADLPRTAADVTDELRTLLRRQDVATPTILVGHSLGGLYAQRYAQRFPDEVAGLVLLDPLHEDWNDYMPDDLKLGQQPADAEMPELPDDFMATYRTMLADTFAAFPATIRDLAVAKHLSPERLPTGFREGANVAELLDELRAGGPRPDVPLILISSAGIDAQQTMFASESQLRAQISASEALYDAIASAAPHAERRTLTDASHATIPMTRPDAVAHAVEDLLLRIRNPSPDRP